MTNRTMLIAVLVATSIGCGQQTSPTKPGSSSSPSSAPTTTIVPAANNGAAGVYRSEFTTAYTGVAKVSLTWANADFSLQLYVTSGVCTGTASLVTGECLVLGSTRPGNLPGIVTTPVTGGERYTIWVLNPDPAPQGFSVDVNIE